MLPGIEEIKKGRKEGGKEGRWEREREEEEEGDEKVGGGGQHTEKSHLTGSAGAVPGWQEQAGPLLSASQVLSAFSGPWRLSVFSVFHDLDSLEAYWQKFW